MKTENELYTSNINNGVVPFMIEVYGFIDADAANETAGRFRKIEMMSGGELVTTVVKVEDGDVITDKGIVVALWKI